MIKFKFVISSDSKVVDANGVIKQNGFSNFKLVPVNSGKGFKATFNEHFDDRIDPVVIELGKINSEANDIKNTVQVKDAIMHGALLDREQGKMNRASNAVISDQISKGRYN